LKSNLPFLLSLVLSWMFFTLAGQGWTPVGPDHIPIHIGHGAQEGVGRIDCIAFHPTDTNTFWIGTPTGGLWKTTNNCETWEPCTDQFPRLGISDIEVHPRGADTLFISTGDRDSHRTYSTGIKKSVDGGESWENTSLVFSAEEKIVLHNLAILPDQSDIQLTTGNSGIYRTENAWDSFELVQTGNFNDIELHPSSSSDLYAVMNNPEGNSSVYVSRDTGKTFQMANDGIEGLDAISRIELAVTRAHGDLVYAVCSNKDGTLNSFYRSVNGAGSWTQLSASLPNLLGNNCDGGDIGGNDNYAMTIAVSPIDEEEIFVGGNHIWKSKDGGENWEAVTGWCGTAVWLLQKHHELEYSPEGIIYTATEGGLYRTRDGGEAWEKLSSNLSILQINNMAISELDNQLILLGTNHNGVIKKEGDQWYFIEGVGHNAYSCIIDHQVESTFYVVMEFGNVIKSTDRGLSFKSVKPIDAGLGARSAPLKMHPRYSGILFAGYRELYKTVDGGTTWYPVSGFGNDQGEELQFLDISPIDPDIIYAANHKKIWKTSDGGDHWQDISFELSEGQVINSLLCSSNDPAKIWAGLGGESVGKNILASGDGGSSWENISEGLPEGPVNCMAYEKNSNRVVYAGTDIGVYVWSSFHKHWTSLNEGLPNVIVNDLQINHQENMLIAATFGRGVWQRALYNDPSLLPFPEFVANRTLSCGGSEIEYSSISQGSITSYSWDFGEGAEPATAQGKGPHLVNYLTTGEKDVSLTINDSITELKKGYVHTVDKIDIDVFPEGGCFTGPIQLDVTGAASYIWSPIAGLNSDSGSTVIANPVTPTEYTVTGQLGSCTDSDTVALAIVFDNICNAHPLEFGENGPFTNLCATVEANEPVPLMGSEGNGCFSQDGWCMREVLNNTVWFTFKPDVTGTISIETPGNFNNQIAVFDSPTCNEVLNHNYTILAANDDSHQEQNSATITELTGLTEGKTYWLMVDGAKKGETGEFRIILRNEKLTAVEPGKADPGQEILLYPNPCNGVFTVEFLKIPGSGTRLEILDVQGRMVHFIQDSQIKRSNQVDLGQCTPGIYHMKVTTEKEIVYRKLIIK